MALFGRKATSSSSSDPTTPPLADAAVDTAAPDLAPDVAPAGNGKKARAPKAPKAAVKPRGLKNGTAVGLNIGNSFIKAVEVTAKNGEISITGMGVVPTPPESYANGNVLSVSALSGAIKTLWKQAGFKSKTAIFSVSGTGSLVVRVIEVPKMSDGELADNMRVDADRYIPFPPSEVIMDFKALRDLPSDPDAPNMEVLLAAAQREVIDLHVRVVQSARLTPGAIDVEPIAAARAVSVERRGAGTYVDYDDVSALLNIGATGTEISVLRGDVIVFTRTVPIGGNNLTTAIAENLGLPIHDAERFKLERGDALPPAGYDPNANNNFDFDEFGGGPGGGGNDLSYGAFDTTQTQTATAGSTDPFDLDFFNQGSQSTEPGAGHAQKEGEEPKEQAPFSFSFDDDLEGVPTQAVPPQPGAPAPAATPVDTGGFSFDAVPEPGPLNLPDEYLPEPGAAIPTPVPTPTAVTPSTTPQPSLPMPIPSAFDFSDFDLPATAEAGATATASSAPVPTPVALTPVAGAPIAATPPADAFGFGFTDEPASTPIATTADAGALEAPPASSTGALDMDSLSLSKAPEETVAAPTLNLGKADEDAGVTTFDTSGFGTIDPLEAPPGDVLTASATSAGADDFDLDAIFAGSPGSASEPGVTTGATASDDSFDLGGLDLGAAALGGAGLGAATARDPDGFDLGAVGGNEDLGDFGVGLGGASLSDTDAITLYNAIHPVLEELASEVRRSLEFHLGRYPDITFSRLLLIGGGARLKNLDAYLTQMIGVPTSISVPSAYVTVNAPKLSPEYVATNSPVCAVAMGLALRDFIE